MYACVRAKLFPSCPTLCDPMDCSLPGSSVQGSPGQNTGVGCHSLCEGDIYIYCEVKRQDYEKEKKNRIGGKWMINGPK